MLLTPKLAAVAALSTMPLLTGCNATVNAPVYSTVNADIHDNTVNGTYNPNNPTPDPYVPPTVDPNAPQDIPDAWSQDSVDTPEPIPLPTPQN
jgi:hypothetical protein